LFLHKNGVCSVLNFIPQFIRVVSFVMAFTEPFTTVSGKEETG